MKKRIKHTFICDGNYYLFRSLFVLPQKDGKHIETEKQVNQFMQKLATDFAYQIRLFDGLIDEVVWTIDSRSWRKDVFPSAEYKGTREKNTAINWDNFQKVSSDFVTILKTHGVNVSQSPGAEGDDLMYAWVTDLNSNGKPVILSTGDCDLVQMVISENSCHTILFAPAHNKLYTYEGFEDWLNVEEKLEEKIDIFNVSKITSSPEEQNRKLLNKFIKKKHPTIVEVNTNAFLFEKVLRGDGGDNVLPAYHYTKTSASGKTRRYGISEKKALLIIDEFIKLHGELKSSYLLNDEFITDLGMMIVKVMKPEFMNREQIVQNLKKNVSLMVLSHGTIPPEIVDDMLKLIGEQKNNNNLDLKAVSNMKKMLEGTPYMPNSKTGGTSSAFFKDDKDEDSGDFSFIKKKESKKPNNLF